MIYICKPERVEAFDNRSLGLTAGEVKARLGCDVVFNAALYNPDRSLCVAVKVDGKWLALESYELEGFGWSDANPKWMTARDACEYDNFIACVNVTPGAYRGRTAFGVTPDGRMVILCVADGAEALTIPRVIAELHGQGCKDVIVLDGGASSQIICPDGEIKSERNVPHYMCVWEKKEDEPMKKFKVCLDPGHGLGESANGSPDGTYKEHEFTLDMGKRIRAHLLRCGIEVLMTREDGSTPSLSERAAKANWWNADLFVSLHSNAIGEYGDTEKDGYNDAVRGLTAWIYAFCGERERAAKLLLAEMKAAGVDTYGYEIYVDNFTVLKKTNMPAYLVEYAFHTAREDVKLLKSAAHRAKLAEATAKAICAWCGVGYVSDTEPEDSGVYRVQVGAFSQRANAESLKKELEGKGYTPFIVEK